MKAGRVIDWSLMRLTLPDTLMAQPWALLPTFLGRPTWRPIGEPRELHTYQDSHPVIGMMVVAHTELVWKHQCRRQPMQTKVVYRVEHQTLWEAYCDLPDYRIGTLTVRIEAGQHLLTIGVCE